MCSLTREYNGFNSDITPFLASLAAAPPAGGRVFGSVTLGNTRFTRRATDAMEVQVRLTGDGRTVTTTSDGGRDQFKDLKPARYENRHHAPRGL